MTGFVARSLLLAAYVTVVCVVCDQSTLPPVATPRAQATDCPRLDSRLRELANSSDPGGFATQAGLDLGPLGVRVVIELSSGAALPAGHDLTVEARYDDLIQARVPPQQLCGVAREAGVRSVAPPARPFPESPRP